MKHIKDPIHGYIDVPEEELSILNSRKFQRLRRIKQLGLSSTVYPSASHSRFAHSLGVMHLAGELGSSIDLSENEIRENQVAGLLHDVGHLPFSHTFESFFESRSGQSHEDISCEYIDELVECENVRFPCDPKEVKNIILDDYDGINLITNEIDCDRLDYLLRDSYHTGIQLGQIEHDTLIKFSEVIDGRLGFDHKSLRSIERLLDARMQMNYSVYSHDTVNITETMVERAVQYHVNNTKDDIMDLVGLDDYQMGQKLVDSDYEPSSELYLRVRNRELYKDSYFNSLEDLGESEIKDIQQNLTNVIDHESEISDMADVPNHHVLVSPPYISDINPYETPIRMPSGQIKRFEDVSPKPQSLRESQLINQNLMVFSPEESIDKVQQCSEEYFNDILGL